MIERLNRLVGSLLQSRFRISTQLYATIGGAVALTISASLVGWFSFDRVGDLQRRVNELRFPELEAAFGVAQYSGALVAAAPRLTTAETPEDFKKVAAGIAEANQALEDQLAVLERQDSADERFQRIRAHADTLISNIRAIETDMSAIYTLTDRSADLRTELLDLQGSLQRVIFPAVDDQFFYTITGHRTLGEPPAPRWKHFSEAEFDRFRHLTDLLADANIATQLLDSAFTVSDAFLIEPLRDKFEASRNRHRTEPFDVGRIPVGWPDLVRFTTPVRVGGRGGGLPESAGPSTQTYGAAAGALGEKPGDHHRSGDRSR